MSLSPLLSKTGRVSVDVVMGADVEGMREDTDSAGRGTVVMIYRGCVHGFGFGFGNNCTRVVVSMMLLLLSVFACERLSLLI